MGCVPASPPLCASVCPSVNEAPPVCPPAEAVSLQTLQCAIRSCYGAAQPWSCFLFYYERLWARHRVPAAADPLPGAVAEAASFPSAPAWPPMKTASLMKSGTQSPRTRCPVHFLCPPLHPWFFFILSLHHRLLPLHPSFSRAAGPSQLCPGKEAGLGAGKERSRALPGVLSHRDHRTFPTAKINPLLSALHLIPLRVPVTFSALSHVTKVLPSVT